MIFWVKPYLSLILFLAPFFLFAQINDEEKKNEIIERRIEQLDTEDAEIDYTSLFDALNIHYDDPINLNQATAEELRDLHLLNDIQINALLDHIDRNGKLLNLYELQTIRGFDSDAIASIIPFVKVTGSIDQSQLNIKRALKDGKNNLFFRYIRILEEQQGFSSIDPDELLDNPNRRYLGDAGEEFFQGTQKNGFDFYSAHLSVSDYGKIKHAVVGDFHAQFGQGLTLWTGQAFGKSIDLTSIKRNARGLKPYTAADENRFLRGAGTTLRFGKMEVSLLGSIKNVDANLTLDTITNLDNIFSSLQQSGFHSTPGTITDKNAIQESVFASNVKYSTRLFSFGVTGARTAYEGSFQRNLGIANQFDFNENSTTSIGADYNLTFRNANLFGEVSRTHNGGIGYIQGLLLALDRNLTFTALYRHYDRHFHTINKTAIGENSRPSNENGLLLGMEAKFGKQWRLTGYMDRFEFPWLKFGVDAPSQGMDGVAQLNWKPKRGTELYFRYRHRRKPKNSVEEGPIDMVIPLEQSSYRVNLSAKVSDAIRLKTRVEWTKYNHGEVKEDGFIAYQDIIFKALSSPFSFSARYALFDTDSYSSRIYAYESDVLYYFSIPAYADQGSRYYLSTKYRVNRNLDLWLRYSQWLYNNRETISSGLNTIDGKTKSEIKFQLRYKF